MLRFELNKIRRGRGSPVVKQGNPSYAAVSLSDIRIPLLWRPRDHMQVCPPGTLVTLHHRICCRIQEIVVGLQYFV